jgi:hypothetical protein
VKRRTSAVEWPDALELVIARARLRRPWQRADVEALEVLARVRSLLASGETPPDPAHVDGLLAMAEEVGR